MNRYAALLRGVSPMNAKMPELKKAFEAAGFEDVVTVLSSGNVVFSARAASESALAKKAEAAMETTLKKSFGTIVRSVDDLKAMLEADPFARFKVPAGAKRIVTFLREAPAKSVELPAEVDGARIYGVDGAHVFTAYVASPKGPVFMKLIEQTFGKDVTSRTWDTMKKIAAR